MLKKRQSLPWITPTIKKVLKKKRLFKRAKSTNNWSGYREYQKHCRRELCRAEWQFINGKILQGLEQKDKKPFWRYIKARKQDNTGVAPLKDKGQLHADSQTKANILLSHFKSVFTKALSTPSPQLPPPHSKINPITISAPGVTKLLKEHEFLQSFQPGWHPQSSPENPCKSDRPIPRYHLPSLPGQQKATHGLALSKRLVRLQERWSPQTTDLSLSPPSPAKFSNTSSAATSFLTSNLTTFWQTSTTASTPAIPLKLNCLLQLKISSLLLTKTNRSTWLSWTSAKPSIQFLTTAFSSSSPTASVTRYTTGYVASSRNGTCKSWLRASPPSLPLLTQEYPQGTVLEPLLFLCYINDLPEMVSSQVRLFADDYLIYREIKEYKDHYTLQQDLKHLEDWAERWGMCFNATKCYVMSIAQRPGTTFMYQLNNTLLKSVSSNPYLGILFSDRLTWNQHINNITKKANSTLGFIWRNLRRCPTACKKTAYLALVRPLLEYGAIIWEPYQK